MNVYDFDKTIYDGDSTLDFYLFCLRKHPSIIFCLYIQITGFIKYKLGMINKTEFKEQFFIFLKMIPDVEKSVNDFWNKYGIKIRDWYKKQQKKDDVIISASPYFLLSDICTRLGINNLIASNVDGKTGKFTGKNCYGMEKVLRFKEMFPDMIINNFYSDSYSDEPMASESENAYIVIKNKILPWNKVY